MSDEESKYLTHSFQVGRFKCTAIDDGGLVYEPPMFPPPPLFLFAGATSEEERNAEIRKHGMDPDTWEKWASPYTCVMIDAAPGQRVLVDTGAGDFAPSTGKLIGALKFLGVNPADISHVVITHAHCDHINGCINKEGGLNFPNARYIISALEHEFWMGPQSIEALGSELGELLVPLARKNLIAIDSRLERIEGGKEIVPGVKACPAFGHTPGHLIVEVNGGDVNSASSSNRLAILGDAIIHPIHCCCPHFSAAVDITPENATKTRERLLKQLHTDGWVVQGYHFPFPGVGRIEVSKDGYKFQPINNNASIPQ